MNQKINVVALGVEDVEAAVAFYERLGWERAQIKGHPFGSSPITAAFFRLNHESLFLGLIPIEAMVEEAGLKREYDPYRSGKTLEYNVDGKEEVDKVIREAQAAGATVTSAPADRQWGGYSGYFKDPDGHLWGIVWNPHPDLP